MAKPTGESTVRTLRVGVNYPDNQGEEIRVEAGEEIDVSSLPPKVLTALDDMGVWRTAEDDAADDTPPDPHDPNAPPDDTPQPETITPPPDFNEPAADRDPDAIYDVDAEDDAAPDPNPDANGGDN